MRRRTAVGVLACALLLAGCAEKRQASQTLPPTAAAATSSSSTAALPSVGPADFPIPAEARQHTPAGVIAFADYYFSLANLELKSLDSQPLRALSRNCQTCTELADGYDRAKAAEHLYEGGELSISSRGSAVLTDAGAEMSFRLEQTPLTVRAPSGAVVKSFPAYSFTAAFKLIWSGPQSTWLVTQFDADRI